MQAGQHRVTGGVDDLGAGGTRIGVDLLDRTDGDDLVAVDEHRAGIERDRATRHGQDDAVAQERGHRTTVPPVQQTVNAIRGVFTQASHTPGR